MTLDQAIDLLLTACNSDIQSHLYVMKMPSCRIVDLAKVLIGHYGNGQTEVEYTGIRPGEKLHELLLSENETINAYEYNENYYVICNQHPVPIKKVEFKEYGSNTQQLLDCAQIREMLDSGGFLK